MNPIALETAIDRLALCERALEALRLSENHQRNFNAHWLDFLIQWKGVYSKVQQAAKDTPQEVQWFGAVNSERRNDPLLRYLFEARNDGEHGIKRSLEHAASTVYIRPTEGRTGDIVIANFDLTPSGEFRGYGPDGTLVAEAEKFVRGEVNLQAVTERDGKRSVPVPKSHLGMPIVPKPLILAEFGLIWLRSLIATARAMQTS